MKIEGNALAGFAVTGIMLVLVKQMLVSKTWGKMSLWDLVMVGMNITSALSIVADITIPPPKKLPYIWILISCTACCCTFAIVWRKLINVVKYGSELVRKQKKV